MNELPSLTGFPEKVVAVFAKIAGDLHDHGSVKANLCQVREEGAPLDQPPAGW